MMENIDGVKNAKPEEVCFGNIDTWIIYNLTNKKSSQQTLQMHQEHF